MRKKRQISFKECYAILEVDKNATLDDVKKAYRRRAFELHPDLNPGDPNAVRNFQLLNEAYVALSRVLQTADAAAQARAAAQGTGRGEARQGGATGPAADGKAGSGAADEAGRERDAAAGERERTQRDRDRERAEAREREQEKQRAREREREKIRRAAAENARKREQEKQAQEQAAQQARQEQQTRQEQEQAQQQAQQQQAQQEPQGQASAEGGSAQARAASAAYGQEDVLRDLLNDPFARRVFEDIYSEVNRQAQDAANKTAATSTPEAASPQDTTTRPPEAPRPESQQVEADWEAPRTNFDFTKGVKGVVKDWLRRQIDEEQTFVLPASSLRPGVRLRLQIRRGLSDELSTIEVTLPRDFVVGKPVRLRGLGKKVGSWQGDLYLTFKAR